MCSIAVNDGSPFLYLSIIYLSLFGFCRFANNILIAAVRMSCHSHAEVQINGTFSILYSAFSVCVCVLIFHNTIYTNVLRMFLLLLSGLEMIDVSQMG